MKMNKKGSMRDVFLISVFAFGLIISGLMALKVFTTINDQFQASDQVSDEAKTTMSVVNTRLPKWIDGAFLLFWILFVIVGLFLAMQIQTNPVFFPVSIFFFLVLTFVSRVFAIIYEQLVASSVLATENATLTIIPYIAPNLHIFSFVFGVVIIAVMVIKR